jgi:tRNA pseudouridine38-40 synthase
VLWRTGRTDTGVHAKQMYAHLILKLLLTFSLVHKLNSFFKNITVYDIIAVADEATRFDALKRTYEYHVNTFKDPFFAEQSWYFHQN